MLWTLGALLLSSPALATGDTGDTGLAETADTGMPPDETDTGDTDSDTDATTDTAAEVDTDTPAPSASTLASELGGFRCNAVGSLASAGPLALLALVALARRRTRE